ncbi:MAG: excalibur calcium-binding domain-containing protein [Janthinobacterium lividum]
MRNLRPPAVLALAALGLVGLAPTASADEAATIYPVAAPVEFYSSFDGQIPVDYTCTVPTTAPDALAVRVLEEYPGVTIAFVGSAAVTCDGTRRSVVVDLADDDVDPNGPVAQPGRPARAQIFLQGTQLDQAVSIVRTDGDPEPPVVTPSIVVDGDVVFTTATEGSVTLDVQCNTWATGVSVSVQGEDKASGDAGIACAQDRTVTVPLTAGGTGFSVGTRTVELRAQLGDEVSLVTTVDLRREATPAPPAPVKKSVSLTVNASPETVTKGKKITIAGSVRRDGKKVKLQTALEFREDGGDYAEVKAVTSSSTGALKTTVTASRSGAFRYTYAGSPTTEAGASPGDHVVVKPKPKPLPKPKAYKNCTALVKVYPHGVGKPGAQDKGGDVTDFTRDKKTYAKNTKSDRDKDGIACER